MKCRNCKQEIPKGNKFCPHCGAKAKNSVRKWIFLSLIFIVCAGAVIAGCYKFGWLNAFKKNDNNDFFVLNYQFTDEKILSAEDAINVLSKMSDDLGFDNALIELSEKKTDTTTNGDKYYRLQQNYNGIPVYGKDAILVTNKHGDVILLSGNVIDINSVSIEFHLENVEIEKSINQYLSKKNMKGIEIIEIAENPIIYALDNKQCLAYQVLVKADNELLEVLVDASNASVLLYTPKYKEDYEKTTVNLQGQIKSYDNVIASKENRENYLNDIERKITSYEMETDVKLIDSFLFIERYEQVYNENEHLIRWNVGEELDNANASDAYVNVQKSYDYYASQLGNIAPDGSGNTQINLYTNYGYYYETENGNREIKSGFDNAFSGSDIEEKTTSIIIGNKKNAQYTDSARIDVVGHEYTHAVNAFHNKLIYKGESGALDEGLADIFGELIQYYVENNVDWCHGDRILKNPSEKDYPKTYINDENWYDTDSDNDNGGVHTNCTVISHAAYLMWYGINGDSKKNLNEQELADLWYRSLLMFPSDCSFSDCRTIVEMTAEQMGLSNYQRRCVAEAFDAVGIAKENNITYIVKNKFNLTVNDINGEPFSNYYLLIDDTKKIDDISIPKSIKVDSGTHIIKLVDKNNENKTYSFTIVTSDNDENRDYITINSDFGELKEENNEEKNVNTEITVDSSYPTTYNEDSMKYQRMVAKDEKCTYMKNLNGELERRNNDGSKGNKVLYKDGFFTICGIDESYIYMLNGSEEKGTYDILRVSKDGNKTDTILKSINWCLHMDNDYFYYVPSDNNKCIRRLNRENMNTANFCEFNEPVEVMVEQDNNFMVVTREDSIFAFFGGASNNYYLTNSAGEIIKEYGSEITVEEYPRVNVEEGNYNMAVKYVSNGYLRSTASEVHLQYGGGFVEAEGISGWNDSPNGIITTLDNDASGENAKPYKIVLYDASTGTQRKMTEVNSNKAFFTMCRDDNGNWYYFDQTDTSLVLSMISNDFSSEEVIKEFDLLKLSCDLDNCGMEIMDNRIYFYTMPDNTTANALYRYDVLLED